jgi:hypothetical protein
VVAVCVEEELVVVGVLGKLVTFGWGEVVDELNG